MIKVDNMDFYLIWLKLDNCCPPPSLSTTSADILFLSFAVIFMKAFTDGIGIENVDSFCLPPLLMSCPLLRSLHGPPPQHFMDQE
eukprot:scaffold6421_cov251-Ochromonas_danica.AAC.5